LKEPSCSPKSRKLFKRYVTIKELGVNTMRTDYILYLLAAVFFLMTLSSLLLMSEQVPKSIWVLSTVVLGLFSVGLGYSQRPKAKTEPCQPVLPMPQTETVVVGETRVTETYAAKSAEEPVATQTEESPAVVMHVDSPLSIQAEVSTP
jgi:hypothetical protein